MPFFIFLYSKARKEPSVSSTMVYDGVKEEGCRQSSERVRGVDK